MSNIIKQNQFKVLSITEDNQVIHQRTVTIQEHIVEKQYQLLSKNNFDLSNPIIYSPGYFNKKTNFILGEKNSILGYDKNLNLLDNTSTSKMFKKDGYILYPIPCENLSNKRYLEYQIKDKLGKIYLDKNLGLILGSILAGNKLTKDIYKLFIRRKLINNTQTLSIDKDIIINSNAEFAVSILEGYYKYNNKTSFFINNNVNIYTISNILNYIGASYSIRNYNDVKRIYFLIGNKYKNLIHNMFIRNNIKFDIDNQLADKINKGEILAVPFSGLTLKEVFNNNMYDLTSERIDATNYSLGMTPFLKNSDGDILAASGIFTKEGLQDAKSFSPENKEYYKNLNDGSIEQWIADDAILGLYNATSQIK